jgi:hypothetical protein
MDGRQELQVGTVEDEVESGCALTTPVVRVQLSLARTGSRKAPAFGWLAAADWEETGKNAARNAVW